MTNTKDQERERIEALVVRLRSELPVCPYDRRSPDYYTTDNESPCTVCGGLPDGPDKCRAADTRCMAEAADALEALSKADQIREDGGWRPIESAPRDNTWFLACATEPGWGATRIVRYADPEDRLPIHGEGNMWPSPPTHWQPLPAPPGQGGEA